jgi:RNA recognition motif-containing protein
MNIFVAKLSSQTRSEDLQEIFGAYGEVTSAKVIMDRETGKSKQFGFVEMADDSEGLKAIDGLNESEVKGSRIVVSKARPREEGSGGGGNRGGFQQRNSRPRY